MSKGKVTVFGFGRLGICFGLVLERAGYDVCGVDIFPGYVSAINDKSLHSTEPRVMEFLGSAKNLKATTSFQEGMDHSDNYFIFVATPSTGGERHYDHTALGRVLSDINKRKVANKHVIIGCTVIPGYINQTGRFLLRDCTNTSLSYNPEFIAQGDIINGLLKPDMVLIGEGSKPAGAFLEQLYVDHCENKPVIARMSAESSEICKLAVNCFCTTKVSFANMVDDIARRTPGADGLEILMAVGADSRVGRKYLRPGYGFGGPCFPRDNRALGGYAEMVGVPPLIPKATDEYNKQHSKFQAEALLAENKDHYVFTGVGYKDPCPVPIIEESQKLVIAAHLARAGKRVTVRDKDFIIACVMAEFGKMFEYEVLP